MTSSGSSIARGTWLVAGAFVIGGLLLVLLPPDGPPASTVHSAGSTYGRILIDSPEVYTRERLVNDRFRQEAWLLDRLQQLETTSIQGVVEGQADSMVRAGLRVALDGKAPPAHDKTSSDEANSATGAATEQDVAKPAKSRQPDVTPIEAFRGHLSFREEVRNAIIENQLDDRHDLGGNTLYRFKFDATVIPGSDTSAWAQIRVRLGRKKRSDEEEEKALRDLYERWISDLQEQVNAVTREEIRKVTLKKELIYEAAWNELRSRDLDSISGSNGEANGSTCKALFQQLHQARNDEFALLKYSPENYECMLKALSKTEYCDKPRACGRKIALQGGIVDTLLAVFGSSLGQKADVRKALEDGGQQLRGRKGFNQPFVKFAAGVDGASIVVEEKIEDLLAVPIELSDSERDAFRAGDSSPRIYAVPTTITDSEREAFHDADASPTIYAVPAELLDKEREAFQSMVSRETILAVPARLDDSEREAFRANGGAPTSDESIIETWTEYLGCGERATIRVAGRELTICASSLHLLQQPPGNDGRSDEPVEVEATLEADLDGQPMVVVSTPGADDEEIMATWTSALDCEEQVWISVSGRKLKTCARSLRYLGKPASGKGDADDPMEFDTTLEIDVDGQPLVVPMQGLADEEILKTWVEALGCEKQTRIRVAGRELKICASSLRDLGQPALAAGEVEEPISIDTTLEADFYGQPMVVPMPSPDKRILEIWTEALNCREQGTVRVAGREFRICASSLEELQEDASRGGEAGKPPEIIASLESAEDGQPILAASVGFQAFRAKLRKSDDSKYLFAYAVTPRESSQQLASSSRRAVAQLFDTGAAGDLGGAGVDIGASRSSRFSEYARIMERRPVVVGIASHASSQEQSAEFGWLQQSAEFGWLIGPKLVGGPDGLATYRHLPSQNSLAALVSAPSWWRRADIVIETGWLDENGKLSATPEKVEYSYSIALPGDQEEITSALLLGGRRPAPVVESVEPTSLVVGEPAKILVDGQHLWRSTVVTIGAQRSKRIFVLPNMKGIIAEFDPIEAQATRPTGTSSTAVLRVWTSEGVARLKNGVTINH